MQATPNPEDAEARMRRARAAIDADLGELGARAAGAPPAAFGGPAPAGRPPASAPRPSEEPAVGPVDHRPAPPERLEEMAQRIENGLAAWVDRRIGAAERRLQLQYEALEAVLGARGTEHPQGPESAGPSKPPADRGERSEGTGEGGLEAGGRRIERMRTEALAERERSLQRLERRAGEIRDALGPAGQRADVSERAGADRPAPASEADWAVGLQGIERAAAAAERRIASAAEAAEARLAAADAAQEREQRIRERTDLARERAERRVREAENRLAEVLARLAEIEG